MSQSPQIGSMFPTWSKDRRRYSSGCEVRRNPLKSGQCFLQWVSWEEIETLKLCRNPLKSGQCFLHKHLFVKLEKLKKVKSQSPQIGSMFPT